jgi:hypothetical protein
MTRGSYRKTVRRRRGRLRPGIVGVGTGVGNEGYVDSETEADAGAEVRGRRTSV